MLRLLLTLALTFLSFQLHAAQAVFAGGCFWCMEADFEKVDGVRAVVSGYTGGTEKNPTYKQVSSGRSQHVEAVQIDYNEEKVSYEELLKIFWVNVDPTVDDRQFCDTGRHYRPAIFYLNEEQKDAARQSKQDIIKNSGISPILVTVEAVTQFWPAEQYHQDFYKKNPVRYKYYRFGCGRDRRLKELWGNKTL